MSLGPRSPELRLDDFLDVDLERIPAAELDAHIYHVPALPRLLANFPSDVQRGEAKTEIKKIVDEYFHGKGGEKLSKPIINKAAKGEGISSIKAAQVCIGINGYLEKKGKSPILGHAAIRSSIFRIDNIAEAIKEGEMTAAAITAALQTEDQLGVSDVRLILEEKRAPFPEVFAVLRALRSLDSSNDHFKLEASRVLAMTRVAKAPKAESPWRYETYPPFDYSTNPFIKSSKHGRVPNYSAPDFFDLS